VVSQKKTKTTLPTTIILRHFFRTIREWPVPEMITDLKSPRKSQRLYARCPLNDQQQGQSSDSKYRKIVS